jgi:hypothetical protein
MKKVFDLIAKLGAVDNMSKTVQQAVGKSQQSLNKFGANADKFGSTMFGVGAQAGAMAAAVGAPLIKMALDAEAAATANSRLNQVFKSMGETTGQSAKKAAEFAESLMFEIAVDDKAILATQAKLATFEGVIKNAQGSSEIFERATKAAFDLQAAGFGDAAGNAVQLGKALNDPIKGMNALTKSGVTFTAQEQAKIKALVNSGKAFEAQQLILTAIEKQVGGVAAATADDSAKIGIAFTKISETLGKELLPIMAELTNYLVKTAIPAFKKFVEENRPMIGIALKGAAALAALLATVSAGSFVIGGIAKTVSGSIKAFQMLGTTVRIVGQAFGFMGKMILANPIAAAVALGIAAIVGLVVYWDEFMSFLNRQPAALQTIIKLFTAPFVMGAALIRGIMQMWNGDVSGGLNSIWETFKAFNPLTILYEIYANIFAFFGEMAGKFYEAGKNIMSSIADGILSAALAPVDAIKGVVSSMRDYLPFSPAKVGPFKDLHKIKIAETIADSIKPAPMVTAISDMAAMATSVIPPSLMPAMPGGQESAPMPALAGAGGGGGMVLNFSPNISINGAAPGTEGGIEQQVLGALRTVMPDLHKMMQDYLDRQARKRF